MIIVLPYLRGRGCDYLLGFLVGETSQWEPALWESNNPVYRSQVENYEDFHLTEAMADRRDHLAEPPPRHQDRVKH